MAETKTTSVAPTRKDRHYRQFASFELRASDVSEEKEKQELYIEGVAVTFNSPTTLYEHEGIEYKEQIDRNAFEGADLSDVIFNYNHSGKVMARTRNKTLQLWVGADGLHIRARLDGTAEGRNLYEEIDGGYIDRMSFAFVVAEQSYNSEERLRTILKIKKLYDVAAVDIPAYDTTTLSARNSFEAEVEMERKAAAAAILKRKVLQTQVKTTLTKFGG